MPESWRPIQGHPGYQASDHGRFLSPQGGYLTPVQTLAGGLVIHIPKRGYLMPVGVSRVMREAFP
jgi:hypothetical protein